MYGILGAILMLVASYFGFKSKQAMGRKRLNDALSSVGGGNFKENLKAKTMGGIYLILSLIFGFGGLVTIAYFFENAA